MKKLLFLLLIILILSCEKKNFNCVQCDYITFRQDTVMTKNWCGEDAYEGWSKALDGKTVNCPITNGVTTCRIKCIKLSK